MLTTREPSWSLRSPDGPSVARDLYDSFHATVEGFVEAVADAGQTMPPKSTFFTPKLRTGLVLRPLDV